MNKEEEAVLLNAEQKTDAADGWNRALSNIATKQINDATKQDDMREVSGSDNQANINMAVEQQPAAQTDVKLVQPNNDTETRLTGKPATKESTPNSYSDILRQHYGDDYQVTINPKTHDSYAKRNNGMVSKLYNIDGSIDLGDGSVYYNGKVYNKQDYQNEAYGSNRSKKAAYNFIGRAVELSDLHNGELNIRDLIDLSGDDISGYQKWKGLLPTGIMNKRTRDAIIQDVIAFRGNRSKFASELTNSIKEAQATNVSGSANGSANGGSGFTPIVKTDADGNKIVSFDNKDMNELVSALKDMSLSKSPKNISPDKVKTLQKILSKYYQASGSDVYPNGIREDGVIGEQTTGALAGLIDSELEQQLARNGITIDNDGIPHYHKPSLLEYLDDIRDNNDYINFELEQKRIERDKRWQNFSNLGRLVGDIFKANAGANVTDIGDRQDAQTQAFQRRYQDALKVYQAKQEQRRQEILSERRRQEELAARAAERAEAQSNWERQFAFNREQNKWKRSQEEQRDKERNRQFWAQLDNSKEWLKLQSNRQSDASNNDKLLRKAAMNQAAQKIFAKLKSDIVVGEKHKVVDKKTGLINYVPYTEKDVIADKMRQINEDVGLTQELITLTEQLYNNRSNQTSTNNGNNEQSMSENELDSYEE